jgi:hypothetical protein
MTALKHDGPAPVEVRVSRQAAAPQRLRAFSRLWD